MVRCTVVRTATFVWIVFVILIGPVTPGARASDVEEVAARAAVTIPEVPPYSPTVFRAALDYWAWIVLVRDARIAAYADAVDAARSSERASGARDLPGRALLDSGGCDAGGGGNYAVPTYIVERESGGNYCAVNPSSGAFGAYQIIPSTWAGSCADLARTPDGQDACASRLVASSGLQPWALTR